jgi:U3 small nucleolar RNA-associated protein 12
MKTTSCIRTLDCGYAICSTFFPGDRLVSFHILRVLLLSSTSSACQIAIGTKSGEIQIFDIAASSLVETIQAHSATVWAMHVRPDGQALVTGSADKDIKFWDIEPPAPRAREGEGEAKPLLTHSRTLKMTDDVLSVRYSPNGKLLAVALLDATVKVFYQDSLKFFISLYGHKVRSLLSPS